MSIPALPVASPTSFNPRVALRPSRAVPDPARGLVRAAEAGVNGAVPAQRAPRSPGGSEAAPRTSAGPPPVDTAQPTASAPALRRAPQARGDSAAGGTARAAGPDTGGLADAPAEGPAGAEVYGFSRSELAQLRALRARDAEVRAHEQAHAAVGGAYAGAPSYQYQRGPDGRQYAVGGSVSIDVAPVPGDPEATIRKMQTVRSAALAPAQPSRADRQVAAQASREIAIAQAELAARASADRIAELRVRGAPGAGDPGAAETAPAADASAPDSARRARAAASYRAIGALADASSAGAGGVA